MQVREPKIELETLEHCIILETISVVEFALVSVLVDRVGKYPIICKNCIDSDVFQFCFKFNCFSVSSWFERY